ncbi:hypothetical protein SeMB42_g02015 [Synchytrium endobioticum]|uniref:Autophagy-related protein 2 n=1 Tax=Synchytrium endobioticum TaxID=286115 RepID=A0A507DIB6_9FUNG|nr:hypothetical protein SeMB42_g02015 [Synchytrium endobioticum]
MYSWLAAIPASFQRRVVRFLLKRAIGQFLLREIDLDDLDVQIGRGHVALRKLELNVDVLNELASNLPFVIVQGRVNQISATVPWGNLWSGHCSVEFDGLEIYVKPTIQDASHSTAKSPVDDSPAIMSSSLHFADDFLHHESLDDAELDHAFKTRRNTAPDPPAAAAAASLVDNCNSSTPPASQDGLQVVAGFMDAILSRLVVKVKNTLVRVLFSSSQVLAQHVNSAATNHYHLDVTLDQATYGEAAADDVAFMDKIVEISQASISLKQLLPVHEGLPPHSPVDDVFDMEGMSPSPLPTHNDNIYCYKSTVLIMEPGAHVRFTSRNTADSVASLYASATEHAPPRSAIFSTRAKYEATCYIPSICSLLLPSQLPVLTELITLIAESAQTRATINGSQLQTPNTSASPPSSTDRIFRFAPSSSYSSPKGRPPVPGPWTTRKSSSDLDNDDHGPNLTAHSESTYFPLYDALFKAGLYIRRVGLFISTVDSCQVDIDELYQSFAASSSTLRKDVDLTTMDPATLTGMTGEKYFTSGKLSIDAAGDALQSDHFKIELHSILAQCKQETDSFYSSRNALHRFVLELGADSASFSEWIVDRSLDEWSIKTVATPAFNSYNDIASFDLYSDPSAVLSQLRHGNQPSCPRFPNRHQPTLVQRNRLQQAIFVSWEQSVPIPDIANSARGRRGTPPLIVPPIVINNHVFCQELKVEFGALHLNLDLRMLDRLSPLLKRLQPGCRNTRSPSVSSGTSIHDNVVQSDTVGSIMQDLEERESKDTSNVIKTYISARMPMIRIWLASPDMRHLLNPPLRAGAHRECHVRPHMLVVDVTELQISTSMNIKRGESPYTFSQSRPKSENERGVDLDSDGQIWELKCRQVGVSLARNAAPRLPGELKANFDRLVQVKHIIQIGDQDGQQYLLLKFEEDEDSGWGLRSWYDLGENQTRKSNSSLYGHRDMDDELMWFKQRAIRESRMFLNCNFPSSAIILFKSDFDLIQLLVNEVTLWLPQSQPANTTLYDVACEDDESTTQSETTYNTAEEGLGIPLVGSKFGYANQSTDFTGEVVVESITVTIHPERIVSEAVQGSTYELELQCLSAFVVQGYDGKPATHGWVDVSEVSILCIDPLKERPSPTILLRRTLPAIVKTLQPSSMLLSSFVIHFDKDLNHKDMSANIEISKFTVWLPLDNSVAFEIAAFLKEAPELLMLEIPTRSTSLTMVFGDFCVTHESLDAPYRLVSITDSLKVSTKLVPSGFAQQSVKLVMHNTSMYLLYEDSSIVSDELLTKAVEAASLGGYTNIRKYWTTLGYVDVASIDFLDVSLHKNIQKLEPKVEVEVTNHQIIIDLCADSLSTLTDLLHIIGEKMGAHPSSVPEPIEDLRAVETANDLLASVDQEAFKQTQPRSISKLDSVIVMDDDFEDDMPYENGEKEMDFLMPIQNTSPCSSNVGQGRPSAGGASSEDIIRCLDEPESFKVIENHFDTKMTLRKQEDHVRKHVDPVDIRIIVSDFDVCLRIHDGYDWPIVRNYVLEQEEVETRRQRERRKGKSRSRPDADTRSESLDAAEMDDDLNSEYPPSERASRLQSYSSIGESLLDDAESFRTHMSRQTSNEGISTESRTRSLLRSEPLLDLRLVSIRLEYDVYPSTSQTSFHAVLTVRDFEVIDNIRTSRWRKFLGRSRGEGADQWSTSVNMFRVDLMGVRTTLDQNQRSPSSPSEELRLRVRILPMRLFVDQDALSCLIQFVTFESPVKRGSVARPQPDMTFFQLVEIQPISFKIDYKPKHLDVSNIRDGKVTEFMNLFHFDSADITLRGVKITGVRGVPKLIERLINEWLPHVTTQVPRVVSGLSGVRPLVNLGSGIADLVLLPIEQFRKNGRIIRGLQRGTKSFAMAATLESITLGARLAVGTQVLLEAADDILNLDPQDQESEDVLASDHVGSASGASSHRQSSRPYPNSAVSGSGASIGSSVSSITLAPSKFSDQPRNIREGVESAYRSLRRNFGDAARTILAIPTEIQENPGAQGTAVAIIRAVPVAVLKPMIGATEAMSKTLLGLRNQIDPVRHQESESKYK